LLGQVRIGGNFVDRLLQQLLDLGRTRVNFGMSLGLGRAAEQADD